jgi:hypothetical protein
VGTRLHYCARAIGAPSIAGVAARPLFLGSEGKASGLFRPSDHPCSAKHALEHLTDSDSRDLAAVLDVPASWPPCDGWTDPASYGSPRTLAERRRERILLTASGGNR